jgi:cephalosporin-C deacetylase-like acetyl esterase
MIASIRKAAIFLLFVVTLTNAQANRNQAALFDYDQNAPLDIKENGVDNIDGIKLHHISYVSPKGGRVTSYLVTPSGKGPFPAIIFMHWGQGNKSAFLAEALLYARAGAVSLIIDAPFERPEEGYKPLGLDLDNPQNDANVYIQSLIDLRRGIDLLQARSDVDKKRVGYIGLSFGGHLGSVLVAVDKRVKTCILMGGPASATDMLRTRDIAGLTQFRKSVDKAKYENYLKQLAPLDAINFVGNAAPASLLFQFAHQDKYISEEQAQQYFKGASSPKEIRWYNVGHEFNDIDSLVDRGEWLRKEIGIGSIKPIMMKSLNQNAKGKR